jgi:hypothetical protein
MSPDAVRERLNLLRTPQWPKGELAAWLGIRFAAAHPLLAQFQMWNTGSYEAAYEDSPTIDRGRFGTFLNSRSYVPLRAAALEFALTVTCFQEVMAAAESKNLAFPEETRGVFPGVYSAEFIAGFFKRFKSMCDRTFPNSDVFFARLHHQFKEHLAMMVEPVTCLTSELLGESHYATSMDAITQQPMSLPYQVFLDTRLPAQLRPDACSWLTYFQFEEILKPALLGRPPDCREEQRAVLQRYESSN